jgi:hypothetical protein
MMMEWVDRYSIALCMKVKMQCSHVAGHVQRRRWSGGRQSMAVRHCFQ